MAYDELPPTLQRARKWYRLGYLAVNALAVVLVGNIPGTILWDQDAGEVADATSFSVFLAGIGLSVLAFGAVQGSNPGYLFASGLGAEEDAALSVPEPEVKPHPCEEKGEEGDEEDSPGAASRRLLATTTTTSDYHPPAYGQKGRPVEEVNEGSGGNSGSGDSSSVISGSVVGSAAGGDGLLWRTDYVRCARCEDMQVPLRSHHCRECGRCVATFDHHCKMIGTCIGERNHCRFWWFLLAQTVSLGEAIRITISGFSEGDASDIDGGKISPSAVGRWASRNALALASSAFLWPCFVLAVTLLVTHSWMATSSLTSYECLKGAGGRGSNSLRYLEGTRDFDLPFSEGLFGNLRGFCCSRDDGLGLFAVPCCGRQSWPVGGREARTSRATATTAATTGAVRWRPRVWKLPERIVRDSEDWRSNLWENKYWSCC
ncbi:unnamed protein product [Pylaiella littoralis]